MKKISIFCFLAIFTAACSLNQQAKEIQTLADCQYSIIDVNNVLISGTDVQKLISNQQLSLGSIPSLALGFISKNIPLQADLTIGVLNPTKDYAAINYFDYEILINQNNFTEGTINQRINIAPNENKEITFTLNTNIYKFLANDSIRNDIQEFITAEQKQTETKALVTIRIKPAIYIGDQLVKYPGFIDIEKELSSDLLKDL